MTDLEWLDSRLRSIKRIRPTDGYEENQGMLECFMALGGFFTATMVVPDLETLVREGRAFEEQHFRRGDPETSPPE